MCVCVCACGACVCVRACVGELMSVDTGLAFQSEK